VILPTVSAIVCVLAQLHLCITFANKKITSKNLFMKKFSIQSAVVLLALVVSTTACNKDNDDDYTNNNNNPVVNAQEFKAAGDSTGIAAKLNEFKNTLGATLNNAPGATGGRREVNWDGVPANLTNVNGFPSDFFGSSNPADGNGRKRGLLMSNTGTSFRVDSTDFDGIDASYADQFNRFSPKKLFVYLGNTVTECTFKVPGSTTDAFIKGFGVIFNDVEDANSTSIEFFNGSKSLGVYKAPVSPNGQFSLLGVFFPDEKITKVKIISGNGLLAAGTKDISSGGSKDLVVMDDFLYDEPKSNQ
jgi:hypothetical protein